ncbi:MAG: hypothetical protein ABH986_06635 [archaeon]
MALEEELKALKGLVKKKQPEKAVPEQAEEKAKQLKQKKEFKFPWQKKESPVKETAGLQESKEEKASKALQEIINKKEAKLVETMKPVQEKTKPIEQKKDFLNKEEKINAGKPSVGLKEMLSNFYYFFEDKYYSVLDKLNEIIPVYKVIDPIDEIIPSFVLFSGIILILLILLLSSVVVLPQEKASLTINLAGEDSAEIFSGYEIFVWIDANKQVFVTDSIAQVFLDELELNSTVKIEVIGVQGFEDFNKLVKLEKKENILLIELKKKTVSLAGTTTTKTIRFKDKRGRLVTELLRVQFECSEDSSSMEIVNETHLDVSISSGSLQLKLIQAECGDVLVSVRSSSFEDIIKEVLSSDTVYLIEKQADTGKIHVKLFNSSNELIQDTLKLSLFEESDPDNPVMDSVSVYSGTKDLTVVPGNYFISVFDSSDPEKYSCESPSQTKELNVDEEISFNVICIPASADTISVIVKDKSSGQPLVSSIELRKKKDSRFEFVSKKTGFSSTSFSVSDGDYIVIVSSDGYLPYEGEKILHKGDSLTVELTQATELTSGKALIKVFDFTGHSASPAKVYLRHASGNLKDLRAYSASVNFNGEALISGIKPGAYYAEALTNEQKGLSVSKAVDANKLTEFSVNMLKSRGFVELKVTELGSSLELDEFEAEFFDALTSTKIPETDFVVDENNIYSFDAGNYFAVISLDGYHTTRTKNFKVTAKTKTTVKVFLAELDEDNPVSIEFLGLFNENGKQAEGIDLTKEYSADFYVTANPSAFYFNFLVGTGTANSMQNDSLYISGFENSLLDYFDVKKTTSFTGNYDTDFVSNSTNGNAKAVLVEFDDFDEKEFDETAFVFSFKIKFRENLLDANNLVVFFKAMAVQDRNSLEYFLDPLDSREFSSLQAYTYSNQKTAELELCPEGFCYSYDISSLSSDSSCEAIDFGSVSSIKLNCPYNLTSFVLNNERDYSAIVFSVENSSVAVQGIPSEDLDALLFSKYLIKTKSNPSGFTGTANSRKFSQNISLKEKQFVYSDSNFSAVKLIKNLNYRVPAIKTSLAGADEDFFELRIRSDLNLNINLSPEKINAFASTPLTVDVLDNSGNPVENSLVSVSIDGVQHSSKETDSSGTAVFDASNEIPELYPLTLIEIKAEQSDATALREILVSDANTFSFSSGQLLFAFTPDETAVKSKELVFSDLSNGKLNQEIIGYSIDFSYSDFFDENSLSSWQGNFSSSGKKITLNLSLDTEKTLLLTQNLSVDANLVLIMKINSFVFDKTIPFTVLINSGSDFVSAYFPVSGPEISSLNPILASLFSDESFSSAKFSMKRKNTNAGEIRITGVELQSSSTNLNLTRMLELLKQNTGLVVSSGTGLILDFNALLRTGFSPVVKSAETGKIIFIFDVSGKPDFIALPFRTEIVPEKDALVSVPSRLEYVFYLQQNSPERIAQTVNFKSSFSDFNAVINSINFDLNSTFVLPQQIQVPFNASGAGKDINFVLILTQEGKALETSRSVTGYIKLNYSVKGRNLTTNIPVKISILSVPGEIASEAFDLKACLGEGSLNQRKGDFDVSFWLGCTIGEGSSIISSRDCSTELPKIKLDWKFDVFKVSSFDAKGFCTKQNLAETNYYYCDASQFSMELVDRIIKFRQSDSSRVGSFDFNATLISDNYSSEFFSDFDFWAMKTNESFDTPTKYLNEASEADYSVVRKYFAENKIDFSVRNAVGTEIQPGWYHVTVSVEPERLGIELFLIKSSADLEQEMLSEDSVFYYIPFDGKIGLKENTFNRINYGSSFDVSSISNKFNVNDSYSIYSSPNLSAYSVLWLRQFDSFNELNSGLYKGTLMELARDTTTNLRTIKFYPSYATPLLLKAELSRQAEPAAIYYAVYSSQLEKELISADNLISWNGLGSSCLDFTGSPVGFYSDRKAEPMDTPNLGQNNLANVFKLSWNNASLTGKTFLNSVVYSPVNVPVSYLRLIPFAVRSNNPFSSTVLYSKNDLSSRSDQNWIALQGVQGVTELKFNSAPNDNADSLRDLFDLIKSGYACVKNQENFSYILWNEEKLLQELDSRQTDLSIDSACIQQ